MSFSITRIEALVRTPPPGVPELFGKDMLRAEFALITSVQALAVAVYIHETSSSQKTEVSAALCKFVYEYMSLVNQLVFHVQNAQATLLDEQDVLLGEKHALNQLGVAEKAKTDSASPAKTLGSYGEECLVVDNSSVTSYVVDKASLKRLLQTFMSSCLAAINSATFMAAQFVNQAARTPDQLRKADLLSNNTTKHVKYYLSEIAAVMMGQEGRDVVRQMLALQEGVEVNQTSYARPAQPRI
jgi:hypothetical protein